MKSELGMGKVEKIAKSMAQRAWRWTIEFGMRKAEVNEVGIGNGEGGKDSKEHGAKGMEQGLLNSEFGPPWCDLINDLNNPNDLNDQNDYRGHHGKKDRNPVWHRRGAG